MNNFFYYTKQERRGIFVLVLSIILVAIAPLFLPNNKEEFDVDYEAKLQELVAERDSLLAENRAKEPSYYNYSKPKPSEKKNQNQKEREAIQTSQDLEPPKQKEYLKQEPKNIVVDVNQATAAEFAQLRGIGEVLSNRIVKFRDKLGGFYSIEQVGTTYGIEPDVFAQFKPQLTISGGINQLNINTLTAEDLSKHPYISEKLAHQIVNFREKVKPFESDEDIKKLYLMNDDLFRKLRPYLVY